MTKGQSMITLGLLIAALGLRIAYEGYVEERDHRDDPIHQIQATGKFIAPR